MPSKILTFDSVDPEMLKACLQHKPGLRSAKVRRPKADGRSLILGRLFVGAMLCLLLQTKAAADEFIINSAELVLSDRVYQLNARMEFDFSKDVLQAIENGVPMVIETEIEFLKPRDYIWDKEVASLEQRYQLQYHALSEQYVVRNLNSGAQYTYFSLTAALQKIGNIDHLPVIDEKLLASKDEQNYYARVRASLSFDNLPVPLKLNALVSRSWWLGSDWVELDL